MSLQYVFASIPIAGLIILACRSARWPGWGAPACGGVAGVGMTVAVVLAGRLIEVPSSVRCSR